MNSSKQEKVIKLEKLIAKGKWYFVVVYGVLFWGLTTAVLSILISGSISAPSLAEYFMERIPSALIIYPIGGIVFGLILWMIINKQYKNLISDKY